MSPEVAENLDLLLVLHSLSPERCRTQYLNRDVWGLSKTVLACCEREGARVLSPELDLSLWVTVLESPRHVLGARIVTLLVSLVLLGLPMFAMLVERCIMRGELPADAVGELEVVWGLAFLLPAPDAIVSFQIYCMFVYKRFEEGCVASSCFFF